MEREFNADAVNDSPQAKSSHHLFFVSKVLLEHSFAHLFMSRLWLRQSLVIVTDTL